MRFIVQNVKGLENLYFILVEHKENMKKTKSLPLPKKWRVERFFKAVVKGALL